MINFVLPYGEDQHFHNWVSITIHESCCTHFVQESQGFEPNNREDVLMFYASTLQSLHTFIKPRSDHCLARVSMICLMLLKAWLIGLWLLIISPGKSCWCSIDIISIVIISAFAESAILLSNPVPFIALPVCPWCAWRFYWRLDL